MSDNKIAVGFDVDTEELKTGLGLSVETIAAAGESIQQVLQGISGDARQTNAALLDLHAGLDDATFTRKRKAEEDDAQASAANEKMLVALHRETAAQEIADELLTENAKYASLKAQLEAENQTAQATAEIHQKLQDQLDAMEMKHNAKMRALNQRLVSDTQQSWKAMLQPITSSFQSSLDGLIRGSETFHQALASMGQSIVVDFANTAVKRASDWIASELTMTTATEAGVTARTAAKQAGDTAGKAADAAAGSTSVFGDANKAAAGAYAATVDIPIVGPVLAPAAAAAAFAAVMAFDIFSAADGFDIPSGLNPLTQLHEREMVLPAGPADTLRQLAGQPQTGGDTHTHFSPNISISYAGRIDAGGIHNLQSYVVKAVRQAHRELAFT